VVVREYGAEDNIWTEETEGWRKLHNEELQKLCSSPSTITKIKSGA
jgi:hypothetical protein